MKQAVYYRVLAGKGFVIGLMETRVGRLSEVADRCPRHPKIGGIEALGEAAVDRGKKFPGRISPALLMPQPGEARRNPQLQGQYPLPPCSVQRPVEELFCRWGGVRTSLQHRLPPMKPDL